jgi:lipoprotein-anchoring transpeptidase ErfK/SrfK
MMAHVRFLLALPAVLIPLAAAPLGTVAHAQTFDPDALQQWLEQDQYPQYPPVGARGAPSPSPPGNVPPPPPPPGYAPPPAPQPGWSFFPPPPPPPPPPGYVPPPPGPPAGVVTGTVNPTAPGVGAPAPRLAQQGVDPEFPVPKTDLSKIKPEFRRQVVDYNGPEHPGTIIVNADNRHLYYVLEGRTALRYGVGVGREGFEWAGRAKIARKAKWPSWHPPADMVARDPKAAPWANGMPGGPQNPLGARALYLYDENGRDTLYRIHGTNDPSSIGKAMSSGCIRMLNEDVEELFLRAPVGTPVVVLSSKAPAPTAQVDAPQPY